MSLVAEITKVIREVMMDGKEHPLSEIKAKLAERNIKIKKGINYMNQNTMSQDLHHTTIGLNQQPPRFY